MGKVKKNWANLDNTASTSKNEEETSESEDDLTQSEEEDSSNMEL